MKTRFASQFHFFNPLPLTSVAVLLLFLQASSAQTQNSTTADYDAARDFSIISNPNGVWSYGWTSSLGSPLNLYTVTDTTSVSGISAWLRSGTYYIDPPLIAHNDTDSVICVPVCVPPALLNVHPGPNDELTVVRWTAPTSGNFFFQGVVVGLDRGGPTTTGFYLVHNSSDILFSTQINVYRLPVTFHHVLTVSAGDTLDFAVDFGQNGNYFGDSTGIQFMVTAFAPSLG
jgi:hypothetical protein